MNTFYFIFLFFYNANFTDMLYFHMVTFQIRVQLEEKYADIIYKCTMAATENESKS